MSAPDKDKAALDQYRDLSVGEILRRARTRSGQETREVGHSVLFRGESQGWWLGQLARSLRDGDAATGVALEGDASRTEWTVRRSDAVFVRVAAVCCVDRQPRTKLETTRRLNAIREEEYDSACELMTPIESCVVVLGPEIVLVLR